MKFVSENSKEEIVHQLQIYCFWGENVSIENYQQFLMTGNEALITSEERKNLFAKILNAFSFHTVVKLIPSQYLKEALQDDILIRLFPHSLQNDYRYARTLLYS